MKGAIFAFILLIGFIFVSYGEAKVNTPAVSQDVELVCPLIVDLVAPDLLVFEYKSVFCYNDFQIHSKQANDVDWQPEKPKNDYKYNPVNNEAFSNPGKLTKFSDYYNKNTLNQQFASNSNLDINTSNIVTTVNRYKIPWGLRHPMSSGIHI